MSLPIRTRLTLVFGALMVVTLIAIGLFVYRAFATELDRGINVRLLSLARELAADLDDGESDVLHDFGQGDSFGYFAQVLAGDGHVVEQKGTMPEPLLDAASAEKPEAGAYQELTIGTPGSAAPVPSRLTVAPAAGDHLVVVGTSLVARHATLRQLGSLLWIAGSTLALAVSGLAWFLAGAALRPVEVLRRQASQITEGDLADRLPVATTGDEVATLATTLNGMLARIERAFERERRFVDDASHELRTPLGILKTELDLALRRSRTKEELETAILSASEESERLNRIAEDLLVLARADRGKLPLRRVPLDAGQLLQQVTARFQRKADQYGVRLEVTAKPALHVRADPARLEQAIGNLIANALVQTPAGGRVTVSASNGAGELIVSVADTGPGFPIAFIDRAFDPFTRADAGRSRRDGGVGLGLAIVKGVVEAHGGEAIAANRPEGGAEVTLRIPT